MEGSEVLAPMFPFDTRRERAIVGAVGIDQSQWFHC